MNVPHTGIERGISVNNNQIVEQKAMPSNYVGKQELKGTVPVIQKAKTSVTLSLGDRGEELSPDEVYVDTINLPNRFPTSLPNGEQGNHTVADVLIKRAQKHAVMGENITFALGYYDENITQLILLYRSLNDPSTENTSVLTKANSTKQLVDENKASSLSLAQWNILLKQVIQGYNESKIITTRAIKKRMP